MNATHPLDHLVLPTGSLVTARNRLTHLGFTVAPNGVHPFGTENCCIYLADGTFMEPLAIANPAEVAKAAASGNVFVARDRQYRQHRSEEGFSAVVFGTEDASADHDRYADAGISAGNMLEFSRPFVDASGKSDTASFRLAFAAKADAQNAFIFACQRLNAPKVDRSTLQAHKNGAQAIKQIISVADDPAAALRFLADAAGTDASMKDGAVSLPNAKLTVLDPAAYAARYHIATDNAVTALSFTAIVFSVAGLEKTGAVLAENDIASDMKAGSVVVAPAKGQGAAFIFEESA
ncbi:VOC family protein [Manganibacter manganicus]|uniref:Lactoylglutathione lyase n=1 Tax=Manganibacter manganicus TaxID=1873176 RepID=A0A1V8RS33_9HYPH|nr:VOC family protein [Pseudaminobacter manganicus]OQM75948.1 lactoylglutathione lyase [Pseudaminobacter manganicus]